MFIKREFEADYPGPEKLAEIFASLDDEQVLAAYQKYMRHQRIHLQTNLITVGMSLCGQKVMVHTPEIMDGYSRWYHDVGNGHRSIFSCDLHTFCYLLFGAGWIEVFNQIETINIPHLEPGAKNYVYSIGPIDLDTRMKIYNQCFAEGMLLPRKGRPIGIPDHGYSHHRTMLGRQLQFIGGMVRAELLRRGINHAS